MDRIRPGGGEFPDFRVITDPRLPPDIAVILPPGHPLPWPGAVPEGEPMTELPRGVRHRGMWLPVSDTLLRHERGEHTPAELAQQWLQRAALARWQAQVAGWHGWAVAYSTGLTEDVLTRHAPVSDDFGLHCAACHEVAARHGGDVAAWAVAWPCEEYRAAAVFVDYPANG